MTTTEIKEVFDISPSTLNDWNQKGHKRNTLSSLLQEMSVDEATRLIDTHQKNKSPKYSKNTRKIKLDKSWFSVDLLWSSTNGQSIEINTIITVYMNRANQRDTDTLCSLFGYERVLNCVQKYLDNELNITEALSQLQYYKDKLEGKKYKATKSEIDALFRYPKQRVVDSMCNDLGVERVLGIAKKAIPLHPTYNLIFNMVKYYVSIQR